MSRSVLVTAALLGAVAGVPVGVRLPRGRRDPVRAALARKAQRLQKARRKRQKAARKARRAGEGR